MKKILCYGDSNTYGFNPQNGSRYDKNSRWTGILSEILAPEYQILEQGMNNRTGFYKNPEGIKQSGGEYLSIYLQNNKDIDLCILSLGTNDTQIFYDPTPDFVEQNLIKLIRDLREVNSKTKIIIVPPTKITTDILSSSFSILFDKKSIKKIETIFPVYKKVANENNCFYFDFNEFVTPSTLDGLHYTKSSHEIIAKRLVIFINKIFI